MTETYTVRLVGGEDGERATFELDDAPDRCLLVCRYRGKTISAQELDFFEALSRFVDSCKRTASCLTVTVQASMYFLLEWLETWDRV